MHDDKGRADRALAEAMNQSPQQSLRRDDGEEVDVGDVSVAMVRSDNIAAAVGRAAAAEEARAALTRTRAATLRSSKGRLRARSVRSTTFRTLTMRCCHS